ncbi:hypothetical protein [Polaromonas sp.]|uniref:hypothetical protein n=1 Tax=Polaromonas sp. TaxID=1869339 RepID=UPI0027310648|nr:hypothetical protein [Polaromonas sp.]MDP1740098.1 hypothetical protein [Polaromonas sp.]
MAAGVVLAQPSPEAGAQALQARYTALAPQLTKNEFGRPLVIESTESDKSVSGHAYAVINYPFATVAAAFKDPDNWCEVLILHLNTKYCRAEGDGTRSVLVVAVGKKHPQEIRDAYNLSFDFRPGVSTPEYLAVQMNADKGPVGTHNYRINFRAVPIVGGKTFLHLQYSYGYGLAGRMAMQGYLATMGNGKLGFTQIERTSGGTKAYVEGMRGAVERNTMRYYLAIDAYLASLNSAAPEQVEKRLQHWFDATERYPRQLHEVERNAYLTMKRTEHRRQHAGP